MDPGVGQPHVVVDGHERRRAAADRVEDADQLRHRGHLDGPRGVQADGRPDQRTFGVLDAVVRRNGYGRQEQSFEADIVFGSGEGPPLPTVFIRAPLVVSVAGTVDVLATLDGAPVLVRQGPVLASSFHPELTADRRVHRLFAEMCGSDQPGGLFG